MDHSGSLAEGVLTGELVGSRARRDLGKDGELASNQVCYYYY